MVFSMDANSNAILKFWFRLYLLPVTCNEAAL